MKSNPIDKLAAKHGEFEVRKWVKEFLKQKTITGIEPAIRKPFKRKDIEARYIVQEGKCNLCRINFPLPRLEKDHVMPIIKGGETNSKNLELICDKCHRDKGTEHPADTAKRLGISLHEIYSGKRCRI